MAGINRLGKGTAKPGTLRPTDPNRFKTEDFFSVDAEDDPEYLRRIIEVEQLAINKTGAVLSKGAFDKNDALYLRDEADKARHDELERRDAELAQFARVRSKIESSTAMEPYDPGPAMKRPKFAKQKVVVKKAGPITSSAVLAPSWSVDTTGGAAAQAPEQPATAASGKVQPEANANSNGTHHDDAPKKSVKRTAILAPAKVSSTVLGANHALSASGLGLQYDSCSDDDSEGSD